MITTRNTPSKSALMSLEAAAAAARADFGCMFSTSEEYESALISERRAQGRYGAPRSRWPVIAFVGCSVTMIGAALLFG